MIPTDIYSWTTHDQGKKLQELALNKTCLEIGAWAGFTTVCMARTANIVYSIDPHVGYAHSGGRPSLTAFLESIHRYHVEGRVAIMIARSENILPTLPKSYFDLSFIDGDHAYEAVKQDIELSLPLMKPESTITFHDYNDINVARAVDESIAAGAFEPIDQVETLLVCRYLL